MKEIKLSWHTFWEAYHLNWLMKHHGKFPENRVGLSVYVNNHLDKYWHHRLSLP